MDRRCREGGNPTKTFGKNDGTVGKKIAAGLFVIYPLVPKAGLLKKPDKEYLAGYWSEATFFENNPV